MTGEPPDPFTIPPVLVLSTGRCGSTMISDLLNRHPAVLSLSEFMVLLGQEAFAHRRLSGARMWRILSRQSPALRAMIRDAGVMEEVLYPLGTPGARFGVEDLPPIAMTALPHLTDRHDALFDELATVVPAQPRRDLAEQYRFLFAHLGRRFGRRVWVERSGGSLMFARKLLRLFPEARVIHVFRDGRDVAPSMAGHPNFRVLVGAIAAYRRFGIDACRNFERDRGRLANVWLERALFPFLDARKLAARPTLADFGDFWSRLVRSGQAALSALPEERVLDLRFEDVQARPREMLDRMIRFIDPSLADAAWLDAAAAVPRPTTRRKFAALPADEQRALTAACAPGLAALGYAI
ncbi:sulfotransferase [Stella sp.]|uniref:sulfotransferase n=1 Tax=Stella sp. TaxID=2912054 RepID=UPI0035AE4572